MGHFSKEGVWQERSYRAASAQECAVVPVALDDGVLQCNGCLYACKPNKVDIMFQETEVLS